MKAHGWCEKHYQRWKSTGDPLKTKIAPKGSGTQRPEGYRLVVDGPVDPKMRHRKQRMEHVIVMERHLGRRLLPSERVHHLNGVRHDNAVGNLELWSTDHPYGQRVTDLLAWARTIIERYEPIESLLGGVAS